MGESGLQKSIWAHTAHGNGYSNQRPGDWTCPSCGFSNYKWRTSCLRCSTTSSETASYSSVVQNQLSKGTVTSAAQPARSYDAPSRIQAFDPHPHIPPAAADGLDGQSGLSVSIWAPRNSGRRPTTHEQVWTRTVPSLPTPISSRAHSPTKAPDLGLPYQVQHYILTMIERMLEESCYEFASRWVPDILHGKRWDCAEAVELSTWRTFLPTSLPPNAIRPMSNYTLETALGDAVRIRNSAVHRHLCDNEEMRRMALQAQDLMSMFSDATRQDKFHRLWLELKEWDTASIVDAQAARGKLEAALQEISERPVDDMDWTPNAMSLQDVTLETEVHNDHMTYPVDDIDEMELD